MLPHTTICLNGHVTLCLGDLTLGHHTDNFSGFRDCGIGDETFSICPMISKDHTFKGLLAFKVEVPHSKSPP